LLPRLVEAVAAALGIKQRRHLRIDAQVPVTATHLQAASPGAQALTGTLANVSESGAKLSLPGPIAVGEHVALSWVLRGREIDAKGTVIRTYRTPAAKWEIGVRFDELPSEQVELIAQFVSGEIDSAPAEPGASGDLLTEEESERESVRVFPRQKLPKALRLKVRLRPREGRRVSYLRVEDLSEGGFLGVAAPKFEPPLSVGEKVEALIFGPGVSVECTAEVVRRERTRQGPWSVGMRFLHLNRVARGELSKALFLGSQ
jgi:c-di-GMP-binding flagellar brake protein YcgR